MWGVHAIYTPKYGAPSDDSDRLLATQEKALGPDHPDVAETLENYAALLQETGRDPEATQMEARAKAIHAKQAREIP